MPGVKAFHGIMQRLQCGGVKREKGNSEAQRSLAALYARGQGLPQDYSEALKWYRKAADQGNADAQLNLGAMYDKGLGVASNSAESAKWFRMAADQGLSLAQRNLGRHYARGDGVPQDFVQAYMWLNLSAAQGDSEAKKSIDELAGHMTPAQVAEAQRLAKDWKPKGPD